METRVPFIRSPNYKRPVFRRKVKQIVLHYTAGYTYEQAAKTFMNASAQKSSHLLIGRDAGEIGQFVTYPDIAWHAKGANRDSIGIEIVSLGGMFARQGKDGSFRYYHDTRSGGFYGVHPENPVLHIPTDKYNAWETFTDWQYHAAAQACAWIMGLYEMQSVDKIVDHRAVDKRGVKWDIGPAWDWQRFNLLVADAMRKPLTSPMTITTGD